MTTRYSNFFETEDLQLVKVNRKDHRMRRVGSVGVQRLFGSRTQSGLARLQNASCWGNPDDGRLGFEADLPGCAVPRVVHEIDHVVQVSCGEPLCDAATTPLASTSGSYCVSELSTPLVRQFQPLT